MDDKSTVKTLVRRTHFLHVSWLVSSKGLSVVGDGCLRRCYSYPPWIALEIRECQTASAESPTRNLLAAEPFPPDWEEGEYSVISTVWTGSQ